MQLFDPEAAPPKPSAASQQTLDPAPLAAWRVHTQDIAPNFVCELINEFLSVTTAQIAILERAAAAGDMAACQVVAKRLQGSCNAIGAFRLATLLEEMELLAMNGAEAFLGSQFAEIRAECGRLEVALEWTRC